MQLKNQERHQLWDLLDQRLCLTGNQCNFYFHLTFPTKVLQTALCQPNCPTSSDRGSRSPGSIADRSRFLFEKDKRRLLLCLPTHHSHKVYHLFSDSSIQVPW